MIGDVIKQLREARNWSQVELARRVGIEAAQVSRIEAGKSKNPTQRTLERFALAFEMPVTEFMELAGLGAPVAQMRAAGASEAELEELQRIWPLLSRPFRAGLMASARAWLAATQHGDNGSLAVTENKPGPYKVVAETPVEYNAAPPHILGDGTEQPASRRRA